MNKKKITAATMLGIAMSLSGTAMAAPEDAQSQDLESRIAAIEQQQQQLMPQGLLSFACQIKLSCN